MTWLAMTNDRHSAQIARLGAIPLLVQLLHDGSEDAKEEAVYVYGGCFGASLICTSGEERAYR